MTAEEVLQRYRDEDLPEFVELPLQSVNDVGNFGNRPIHVAAIRGNPEELAALIAGGADVNAVGELGNQPIHEAIGQQNTDVLRLLLDAGAKLDGVNEFGETPLDKALKTGNQAIIDLIQAHLRGARNQ